MKDTNNTRQSWIRGLYEVCVVSLQMVGQQRPQEKKRPNKLGIGSHTLARVPRIAMTSNPAGTLIRLRISAALQTHFQHLLFCARSV